MQAHPSVPKLVLVVDDNVDAQVIASFMLGGSGYEVAPAASIEEARRSAARRTPDVVVLDCRLPDGDGLELARAWRNDPAMKHVPIIVLTAFSARQDVEAAVLAGVDAFLVKPVPQAVLAAQVAKVLARGRSSQTLRRVDPR